MYCLRFHRVQKSYRLQKVSQGLGNRFILTDFLYSFWKQLVSSFFKNNNSCVPDQGNSGHHAKTVTEKGDELFIKYSLRLILCRFFLSRRHLLFLLKKHFSTYYITLYMALYVFNVTEKV